MAIPLSYNFRNLAVRKTTTLMTALGVGLTVAVLLAVLALVTGLETAFSDTGNPLQVLVMRKGATAELSSGITRQNYQDIKFKPGIAKNAAGEPMASLEMVTIINLQSVDSINGMNVTLRGLLPIGLSMRNEMKLASGRWFEAGKREVTVGKGIAKRFPDAQVGKQLKFGKGSWTVVGVFDAGESAANSEIFGDLNQISSDFDRADGLSSVLVRAQDRASVTALINAMADDPRLGLEGLSEVDYYKSQTSSGAPIKYLGLFIAIIMAVGSSFAAMNTMYAAVSRRAKEIGTLRVLGFSKGSILVSFFIESVALALIGGVIGCLLALPLNGVTTAIGSFVTFSEISFPFEVTPKVMMYGLIFAAFMGAAGGLLPARSAAKKEILTALREV
ncbi:MAG TPA: ABC transporter permease [Bryobacteraceae bacterium]|jgi:putative ABC transport system permease protein